MRQTLGQILDLEQVDDTLFRALPVPGARTRAFGGQVAAQALAAAGRTVEPDRQVHSMHAYFLRLGDTTRPIIFKVERIRDGRAYSTRRVVVVQGGRPIFHANCSFARDEEGFAHQTAMPQVPRPEDLRPPRAWFDELEDESMRVWGEEYDRHPVDLRFVGAPVPLNVHEQRDEPVQHLWFRTTDPLPELPVLHAAAVAYASDLYLLGSALLEHGRTFGEDGIFGTSVDHAVWFHGEVRADRWLLFSQDSPWAGLGRGLTHGRIFTEDGRLAATVVQEGVFRSTFSQPTPT